MPHEINCENCWKHPCDIDHLIERSQFWKNNKDEQDKIENLMALCRKCHSNKDIIWVDVLTDIHLNNLKYT